jgi:NADPH:quinone reductase-like Zn-dependent oxidoreductase
VTGAAGAVGGFAVELAVAVAGTLPLDQVAAAHERLARGGLRGRLVLVP